MTFLSCAREKEVTDLLHRGHWPDACPAELRVHVERCRSCADLALVGQAFQRARISAAALPRLESPGVIWWRAQLRRRNAAVERIGKPILGAQIFALAVSLIVAAGLVAWQIRRGFHPAEWLERLPGALHLDVLHPSALLPSVPSSFDNRLWLIVPILATVALLGGLVVYLASEKH